MEIAGLVESQTPRLREQAVRFAARSAPITALSDTEKQQLEAIVKALAGDPPGN